LQHLAGRDGEQKDALTVMSTPRSASERPLSPHLGIYHFYVTMAASILHRITGAALYFGVLILVGWLLAAASGPSAFGLASAILGSWLGRMVLFAATFGLFLHMLGGVRHLVWDTGAGLDPKRANGLASASFIGAAVLTVLVWIAVLMASA
jgi:succinate dehydrogenase / fumarate reductase cytochrome b subunit